ncbi:MAG: MmcQ/YjbR family DNA-binding protein [Salinivirgaceae bacterium]
MNIEAIRTYCLNKKGTEEAMPFGDDTLVFKVMGKMFALTNLEGELTLNLKCDPDLALDLREQYPAVLPGYHMNKQHWNTIVMDGSVSKKQVCEWIDLSYDLVVGSLTKKIRDALNGL